MAQSKIYDLVVVGAGMMGSAAAHHAAQISGTSVCLIGPAEPKIRKDHEIFGAWYDEGRICSHLSSHRTWSLLVQKSIDRFRNLENQTGVNFYQNIGHLRVTVHESKFHDFLKLSHELGFGIDDVTSTWKNFFSFLNLPDEAYVLWDKKDAGHISPRNLVKAHQTSAQMCGAHIVRKIVSTVRPSKVSSHKWEVDTECGSTYLCQHVLVAAGGFASFKHLFKNVAPNMVPDLELRTQTVSYLKIKQEEAHRLRSMPTVITDCQFENLDGAYILPPILYPDGQWYLKLGHHKMYEEKKRTLPEIREWYVRQSGIPECVDKLARFLQHMLPDLNVENVSGDGCLTSHTPNVEPYIDLIADGFGVALGGNGYAAKSCDEIGRLAAHLVLLEEWDSDIPRDKVKIIWKSGSQL